MTQAKRSRRFTAAQARVQAGPPTCADDALGQALTKLGDAVAGAASRNNEGCSRAHPNPYAIEAGDRVVFTSGYPITGTGQRKQIDVRGIVDEIEWDAVFPEGMAYIRLDMTSIPPECRDGASELAAVRLPKVRHDRRLAA